MNVRKTFKTPTFQQRNFTTRKPKRKHVLHLLVKIKESIKLVNVDGKWIFRAIVEVVVGSTHYFSFMMMMAYAAHCMRFPTSNPFLMVYMRCIWLQ
jgi:presenilin-like A22 family membrane protease